jgi:hypothetical protein
MVLMHNCLPFPFKLSNNRKVSTKKVDDEIQTISPDMDEYTIGLSKYLYGHKVKLQTEFS